MKDLDEALAGALGALAATAFFYPVDVAKTRVQSSCGKSKRKLLWSRTLATLVTLCCQEGAHGAYKGLPLKALNSVVSSFLYFYTYAALKKKLACPQGNLSLRNSLFAGSLAGAITTLVTLPLDVITTRLQTASDNPDPLNSLWNELAGKPSRFWKGLVPSLLLTTNPAINYTIFDRLKKIVLQHDSNSSSNSAFLGAGQAFLFASVAKIVATLVTFPLIRVKVMQMASSSKISSKNNLLVNNSITAAGCFPCQDRHTNLSKSPDSKSGLYADIAPHSNVQAANNPSKDPNISRCADGNNLQSLTGTAYAIWESEGGPGFYIGCGGQLLHTVLKSAFLLVVKEEISIRIEGIMHSLLGSSPKHC